MGKSAPAAPDYTGAAKAQGDASLALTNAQTAANRPNLNTPWGSQTWSFKPGTPATGQSWDEQSYLAANPDVAAAVGRGEFGGSGRAHYSEYGQKENRSGGFTGGTPATEGTWESNISLTPDQQAALDSQTAIQKGRSQGAQTLLDQATGAFQAPIDYNSLPGLQTLSGDGSEWRQKGQSAMEQLMAPQLAARRGALETKLANQGITMGSDAWKTAMSQMGDEETTAGLRAIDAGRTEANNIFDTSLRGAQFGNQTRQQAMAEMLAKRSQPLNELNALLTGQQVANPAMPSFQPAGRAETPQYMQAAQNQYSAALDSSNASNAGIGGFMNGLFSLGSAGIQNPAGMASLFALSDQRLKKDIQFLFELPNGIRVYKYRFIGKEQMEIGVLAQEVSKIMPDAVRMGTDGYYRVNYDMVLA